MSGDPDYSEVFRFGVTKKQNQAHRLVGQFNRELRFILKAESNPISTKSNVSDPKKRAWDILAFFFLLTELGGGPY